MHSSRTLVKKYIDLNTVQTLNCLKETFTISLFPIPLISSSLASGPRRLLKTSSNQVFQVRVLTHTVNGQGASVRPKRPCRGGGGVPSGSLNLNACSKQVTVRNSSIFASCSPMHTLRPIPNGMKHSFRRNVPSSSKKRAGLKLSGSSHRVGSLWTDHRLAKITVPLGIV